MPIGHRQMNLIFLFPLACAQKGGLQRPGVVISLLPRRVRARNEIACHEKKDQHQSAIFLGVRRVTCKQKRGAHRNPFFFPCPHRYRPDVSPPLATGNGSVSEVGALLMVHKGRHSQQTKHCGDAFDVSSAEMSTTAPFFVQLSFFDRPAHGHGDAGKPIVPRPQQSKAMIMPSLGFFFFFLF
ncbi:hypothetical protein BC940DRAFT_105354 [Gongronella butleri]|nr:hypothetical protein BC940DRAFT_105354 [Gongronella butleri]